MTSYLVTGGSGQLGQCFQAVVNEFPEINLFFISRNEVDITRPETIVNFYNKNPLILFQIYMKVFMMLLLMYITFL